VSTLDDTLDRLDEERAELVRNLDPRNHERLRLLVGNYLASLAAVEADFSHLTKHEGKPERTIARKALAAFQRLDVQLALEEGTRRRAAKR
jgi:hypothetical protein